MYAPSEAGMIFTVSSNAGLPTQSPSGFDSSSAIFSVAAITLMGSASVAPYIIASFLSSTVLAIKRTVLLHNWEINKLEIRNYLVLTWCTNTMVEHPFSPFVLLQYTNIFILNIIIANHLHVHVPVHRSTTHSSNWQNYAMFRSIC